MTFLSSRTAAENDFHIIVAESNDNVRSSVNRDYSKTAYSLIIQRNFIKILLLIPFLDDQDNLSVKLNSLNDYLQMVSITS